MATLKGQNLRIYTVSSSHPNEGQVIAMATNCTITLTGNTEEATHKDIVGMSSMPTITSKAWSVQVETLNVVDASAMLAIAAASLPVWLKWDTSSTTDNQTAQGALMARYGMAYLNDVTFNFNDRENSTTSLQFTGSGELQQLHADPVTDLVPVNNTFTKGQFVRLFLGSDSFNTPEKVIAAAMQLSLHISVTMENATTKDTDTDWQIQEPTAVNFDITTSALVQSGETITSQVGGQEISDILDIYENALPVKFQIANVGGPNQREKYSSIAMGSVVLSQLTINGPNRQNATYQATLSGYGPISVSGLYIKSRSFNLPISQAQLKAAGDNNAIELSEVVSASELVSKLHIGYITSGATAEADLAVDESSVAVSISGGTMFYLTPSGDGYVWVLTGIAQTGPTWAYFYV